MSTFSTIKNTSEVPMTVVKLMILKSTFISKEMNIFHSARAVVLAGDDFCPRGHLTESGDVYCSSPHQIGDGQGERMLPDLRTLLTILRSQGSLHSKDLPGPRRG